MADPNRPTDRPVLNSAERRAILAEYDSYPRGDPRRGELLRRHGLSTSQLAKWRQRLAKGDTTLEPQPPGPKPEPPNPLAAEVARLQRENARLQAQLAKAETVIDIQKKLRRCWVSCRPSRATSAPGGAPPRCVHRHGIDLPCPGRLIY